MHSYVNKLQALMASEIQDFAPNGDTEVERCLRSVVQTLLTGPRLVVTDGVASETAWGSVQAMQVRDLMGEHIRQPFGLTTVSDILRACVANYALRRATALLVDASDATPGLSQEDVDKVAEPVWKWLTENYLDKPVIDLVTTPRGLSGFYYTEGLQDDSAPESEVDWPIPEGKMVLKRDPKKANHTMAMTSYTAELWMPDGTKGVHMRAHLLESNGDQSSTAEATLRADALALTSSMPQVNESAAAWHASGQMDAHSLGRHAALIFSIWERRLHITRGSGSAALKAVLKAMRQYHPHLKTIVLAGHPAGWPFQVGPMAAEEIAVGIQDARQALGAYIGELRPEQWLGAGARLDQVVHAHSAFTRESFEKFITANSR